MNSNDTCIYKQQLQQVNQALSTCSEKAEREELLILKANIEELLSLTNSGENPNVASTSAQDSQLDEFALFMAEMEREGAIEKKNERQCVNQKLEELKDIEGMKCRALYKHQWGQEAYHNAMICSVVPPDNVTNRDDINVRVLFINPTHQEMLPCPYYYESDCKFSDDKCRYSHGEIVSYSSLKEYIEPKFDLLTKGSIVLAKQSNDLWYRAIIRRIYNEKCLVRFESNKKEKEVILEHIFPLNNDESEQNEYKSSEDDDGEKFEEDNEENIINMSLMITPSSQALGEWEKYTKGIGSKLMQKMGYIVGTGLGRNSEGRINPVTAVILPSGKSLDHCMNLREQAGGDKDLFSVEKKLKRLQKRQEKQNQKIYEREANKTDVFNFINKTLSNGNRDDDQERIEERQKMKKECLRNLNIRSLQVADNIKRAERDLVKLRDCLARHSDVTSNTHLKLKDKLMYRQDQLKMYQTQASMIRNEQSLRNNKKKMTIF